MRALSLIVRIILILFIIRMIVMFFRGRAAAARRRPAPQPARTPDRIGGDLVRDPQCGTYVPRVNAIGALVAGKMEYFCSAACRDKALAAKA